MKAERDVVVIDRHRAWVEEPYALVMQLDGDIKGDHQAKLLDMLDFVGGGEGPIVIMQDLSAAGAFTAAARKAIIDDPRTVRVATVICIGANFQMRVLLTMILKGIKFVKPRVPVISFARDEAEARELLASERERLKKNEG